MWSHSIGVVVRESKLWLLLLHDFFTQYWLDSHGWQPRPLVRTSHTVHAWITT